MTYNGGERERTLTKDEILNDITLFWLTNSAISSAHLYWERTPNSFDAVDISLATATTVFRARSTVPHQAGPNALITSSSTFNEVEKGGHFAAWEEPERFSSEIRAAFRSLLAGPSRNCFSIADFACSAACASKLTSIASRARSVRTLHGCCSMSPTKRRYWLRRERFARHSVREKRPSAVVSLLRLETRNRGDYPKVCVAK
jgi:hypothetical protein